MNRFFVPPEWIVKDRVVITGAQVHQMRKVLRLKPGDPIILLDNSGTEYRVEIASIGKDKVVGHIQERSLCQNEPSVEIVLYQALLKASKFELVLQQCTQVGVAGFVPIACERCVAEAPGDMRIKRWEQIITESAEQSRRGKIPYLRPVTAFSQSCSGAAGLSLLPWEGEHQTGLKGVIAAGKAIGRINIFIGPEGGFSAEEVALARSKGLIPITLGNRILRADTAGLVAAVTVLAEMGELGD